MSISSDAYIKAILHCMKHPTQPVMGFLLGKPSDNKKDKSPFISDAVPVQHTNGPIFKSPAVEVAFMQCQAVGRSKGLSVVGVYAANEHIQDNAVSEVTKRWANFVGEQTGNVNGVLVWQINNSLVAADGKAQVAISQYINNNLRAETPMVFGRWNTSTCGAEAVATAEVLDRLAKATEQFLHLKLWDFEEHLEDVSLDFFNQRLLEATKE